MLSGGEQSYGIGISDTVSENAEYQTSIGRHMCGGQFVNTTLFVSFSPPQKANDCDSDDNQQSY